MYIISACLLGENCKYNGKNNLCSWVEEFAQAHSFCTVCPETQAGLPCPRPPAEIKGERVVDRDGKDLTEAFLRGAELAREKALAIAAQRGEPIEGAILKAKSPSCGCGQIYDGTFSRKLIPGDGYLVRLLKREKIRIVTEKEKIEW